MRNSKKAHGFIFICIFLIVSITSPYHLALGEDSSECEEKPKAYILVGNIDGPGSDGFRHTANEALSDFLIAGYDVVKIDEATVKDVQDAINDPCCKALMIIAHGGGEEKFTASAFGKSFTVMGAIESIEMTDGWITGDPQIAKEQGDTLLSGTTNIESLYLHSCSQNLPSWRSLFPNMSEFYGWTTRTWYWSSFWWQWFHRPTSAEELGQKNVNSSIPEKLEDQTLMPSDLYDEFVRPGTSYAAMPFRSQLWGIPLETLGQLPYVTVNHYAMTDDGTDQLYLFSLAISDIQPSVTDGVLPGATTEITMKNSALLSVLNHPDNYIFYVHTGDIMATGSYIPSDIEMAGLGALVFGPDLLEPRVRLIDIFESSSVLARTGLVSASHISTGQASGLISRLKLRSNLKVPLTIEIGNSGLGGMILVNPNQDQQDEIISHIPGVFMSPTYRPTSEVTLNPGESVELPVIGYCINYDKDTPSEGTEFSLDNVSAKADTTPILKILDILENTTYPEDLSDEQILDLKQVAVWSILPENNGVTRGDYYERGYMVPNELVGLIEEIYQQAEITNLGEVALLQEGEAFFTLEDVQLTPRSLSEGEKITVSGKYTNTGNIEGSTTIELKVDDIWVDEKTVTLSPGDSTTISFEVTATGEGEHTVVINGYTGSYTVKQVSFIDQIPGFNYQSLSVGLILVIVWLSRTSTNSKY